MPTAQRSVELAPDQLVALGNAVARLARGFRAASSGHGLSPSQLAVLAAVVRQGPIGVSALAEVESINPTLLSRIVGRLEQEGLLERRPGAGDRRCIVVAATAAGRRLQSRVRSERSASLAARLDTLGAADVRAIAAAQPALERLARVDASGGGA